MSATTFDIEEERGKISIAANYLNDKLIIHVKEHPEAEPPRVLIICGSGLGGISNRLEKSNPPPLTIPYEEIPGFKRSTVPGHSGSLMFGKMLGTPVVLMNGRLHGYEGNTIWETVFPVRVINHMGHVNTLIVTNAAGGVNPEFNSCDMMCIYDHINFPGLAGLHPLKGPNFDELGPRFLPLSDAYDLELRKLLFKKWKDLLIERPLREGTYTFVSGPTFESRAESRMIRNFGGDAVGMSTVPEVIVARHCGWKVLALSLITNKCVLDPPASALDDKPVPLEEGIASHMEVLENGRIASMDVEKLIEAVVGEL
ncbi:purine nucleoside phosphorylase [Monosporozyma unispora]|nr:Purine nucleoside phosphorylase [Kazachstania unispora]